MIGENYDSKSKKIEHEVADKVKIVLPEDTDKSSEELDPHIADYVQNKKHSLKHKIKAIEEIKDGKKNPGETKERISNNSEESEDTLADDSGSNTSLKDNITMKEGEATFWSETFLHKISQTD